MKSLFSDILTNGISKEVWDKLENFWTIARTSNDINDLQLLRKEIFLSIPQEMDDITKLIGANLIIYAVLIQLLSYINGKTDGFKMANEQREKVF